MSSRESAGYAWMGGQVVWASLDDILGAWALRRCLQRCRVEGNVFPAVGGVMSRFWRVAGVCGDECYCVECVRSLSGVVLLNDRLRLRSGSIRTLGRACALPPHRWVDRWSPS